MLGLVEVEGERRQPIIGRRLRGCKLPELLLVPLPLLLQRSVRAQLQGLLLLLLLAAAAPRWAQRVGSPARRCERGRRSMRWQGPLRAGAATL